jgi:hypothetical protein
VRDGGTLRWSHANLDNRVPLQFTGPDTTLAFGRRAAVPFVSQANVIGLGNGSDARLFGCSSSVSSGDAGIGEIVFNSFGSTSVARGWQCIAGGSSPTWEPIYRELTVKTSYDPPSVTAGSSATTTVSVAGAVPGDMALASFSANVHPLILSAYVSTSNTVTVVFSNPSASAQDLASGTLFVKVTKQ